MEQIVVIQIWIIAILFVISAIFSAAEVALISLHKIRVRKFLKEKRIGAISLAKLKEEPHTFLFTILIGNNIANITIPVLATLVTIELFGSALLGAATGIVTFILVFFCEIVPKSIAIYYNEKFALFIAPFIYSLSILFYPINLIFNYMTKAFLFCCGMSRKKAPSVTEEDVKMMVTIGEEEGTIRKEARELIHGTFRFGGLTVRDIMVPMSDVVCIDKSMSLKDFREIVISTNYSRMPVYEGIRSKIVGIVNVLDFLKNIKFKTLNEPVEEIMRRAFFVKETDRIQPLLRILQKRKQQVAIVIDNKRNAIGIVTMEDILEEIIGEIEDEKEHYKKFIQIISPTIIRVGGRMTIDAINNILKTNIQKTTFGTITGLILQRLGRIPKEGESFDVDNVKITVERVEGVKIQRIKIQRKEEKI